MSAWSETKNQALKTEEAALLPALPRSPFGSAALKWALRGAGEARVKQVNVAAVQPQGGENRKYASLPLQPRNRAALRHALRRP